MSSYEVPEPILNSPFAEPAEHWYLQEGRAAERRPGRRPSLVFPPRNQNQPWDTSDGTLKPAKDYPGAVELALVNRVRERVAAWCAEGYPGVSNTTDELLRWWRREGRHPHKRLFYAQLEAAETIIFLAEARPDFLQGIEIPRDEPGEDKQAQGYTGFLRYACKMATGTGKTTVMGMLSAWSILNKVNDRGDARFSDVVLVVCPNVTIRRRLAELDPQLGDASIYRARDLVPPHLMATLNQGRVLVMNWHYFEPKTVQVAGASGRVMRAGIPVRTRETIHIGQKTTTARGKRYLTPEDYARQVAAGLLAVRSEEHDRQGNLTKVVVESVRYVQSDTALLNEVLGREVGGKQNILVLNDEAHHAYRIQRDAEEDQQEELDIFGEEEEADEHYREATVWIDGLDRIQKHRGINFCVDLSATPYYLGRVNRDTGRPFPWVVSDFGLVDSIESGLVKVPQLVVRDPSGRKIPGYFNIWQWILEQMTPAERGAGLAQVRPSAVLKYAHTPIAMLGSQWEETLAERQANPKDPRPPVFILVCKNTRIAKVIYEWLGENKPPAEVPPANLPELLNNGDEQRTIRVDSKVVHETDTEGAKSDHSLWMRFTLDTVGKREWPADSQGRPLYPEGFEALAKKLERPLHPPGRDVRCIVSVGMLTEGWDCNTVTHIIGLRPFMSQLLCEQVVGRGLRRMNYDLGDDDRYGEEVAKVFGVPFDVMTFKSTGPGPNGPRKRWHVHAIPEKAQYGVQFPRVIGYRQAIRNRVSVDWDSVATLVLDPTSIPPEVDTKAYLPNYQGRPSLVGPGKLERIDLNPYRSGRRFQELVFDLAGALTREYLAQGQCEAPAHVLFPQLVTIVRQYLETRVKPLPPAEIKDVFLAPYYGWVVEVLTQAIRPDTSQGETPEVPRYETQRGPGSTAEVDYWTTRDEEPPGAVRCHLNYVVPDTARWEQSATYFIDTHPAVEAFVKNAGLGFAIPYTWNGQPHEYLPDFIIRLKGAEPRHLILETKGYDEREETKRQAAERWVAAVNADGQYGQWRYALVKAKTQVAQAITDAAQSF